MKYTKTLLATAMLAGSFISQVQAEEEPTHTLGFHVGGGGLEYKGQDTDGEGVGQSYLYYNYKMSPDYYIEVGLMGAEDDDWECKENDQASWDCYSDYDNPIELQADHFEFGAIIIAIKTDLALSERNSLYGKVGASFYDYEMGFQKAITVDEDGVGFIAEAGWEYRWDTEIGMNVGLQYQDMDDLTMHALTLGISYSF